MKPIVDDKSVSFWEIEFPGYGSRLASIVSPFRTWSPQLKPRVPDLEVRIQNSLGHIGHKSIGVYSCMEMSERIFDQIEKNAEELEKVLSSGQFASIAGLLQRTKISRAAVDFVAKDLLTKPPAQLCAPIPVRDVRDLLVSKTRTRVPIDVSNRIGASIYGVLGLQASKFGPGAIRDLLRAGLFWACASQIAGDQETLEKTTVLNELLLDGNWPVAVDWEGELIVLVEK